MAIYTESKEGLNDSSSVWGNLEPLLTVEDLKSRYLFGIPMVSGMKNPETGKPDKLGKETLTEIIKDAVAEVESMCHVDLFPVKKTERHPFDPQEWASNGYLRLRCRPVASIENVQIITSDETPVFTFNLDWVETGLLHLGQINIMPLLLTLRKGGSDGGGTVATGSGNVYLSVFGGSRWMPALITISYTCGFKDGMFPRIVNDLIGTMAAMNVLSLLAPTYGRTSSASLSLDGMSQSTSTPGSEIFLLRFNELEKKRDMLVRKLKTKSGQALFSGNV
jgi:hypothetical protein